MLVKHIEDINSKITREQVLNLIRGQKEEIDMYNDYSEEVAQKVVDRLFKEREGDYIYQVSFWFEVVGYESYDSSDVDYISFPVSEEEEIFNSTSSVSEADMKDDDYWDVKYVLSCKYIPENWREIRDDFASRHELI